MNKTYRWNMPKIQQKQKGFHRIIKVRKYIWGHVVQLSTYHQCCPENRSRFIQYHKERSEVRVSLVVSSQYLDRPQGEWANPLSEWYVKMSPFSLQNSLKNQSWMPACTCWTKANSRWAVEGILWLYPEPCLLWYGSLRGVVWPFSFPSCFLLAFISLGIRMSTKLQEKS